MRRVYLLTLTVLLSLVLLTACKSTKQLADNSYPQWLQEKFEKLNERYSEITLFEYEGQPYYAVFVKGPEKSFDLNRTTVYDADGNVYMSLGGPRKRSSEEINFFNRSVNKGIIWQSDIAKEKSKE